MTQTTQKKNELDPAVLALLARVRQHIAREQITLVDISIRTGIQANNISRILQGHHNPRLDMLMRILNAVDLEIALKKIPKTR